MEFSQFIIAIIAIVVSVLAINIGLIAWFRTESRSDHRSVLALIEAIKDDMKNFNQKFYDESKDFHGRLCSLEERYQDLKLNKKGIITK